MDNGTWQTILVAGLALNAASGFGYRIYRLQKGGPMSDVAGQAILGLLLAVTAVAAGAGWGWSRVVAIVYALLFGLAVMPIWVLAVLIPLRPGPIDLAFTITYWIALAAIAVAGIAA